MQETKNLLKKYNFQPIHGRGQNFLIDEKVLEEIVDSANLKSSDVVLEVGPGMGVLTKELAKRVKKVIAVELDKNLVKVLKQELKDYKNIEIISDNILKIDSTSYQLPISSYKIVANLPYNITSKFIRTFLEIENQPIEMILMVQKEVAERITAKPGQMSILGVACQFYADCKIEFLVKKTSFLPIPKVDSATISLKVKSQKSKVNDNELFFKVVKTGFSSKRKKLKSNLSKGLDIKKEKIQEIFDKLELKENTRAQELLVEEWVKLVNLL
ncbi:ribosomal RNA small subunit methyltransferase A [Candidatus Falkowbacteria bacterium]|nr:ribosomal RNA small subunit methyltransferase A [Candidatus Falkowbacteria bacterium]MBT4433368.1 ribosomal RNA small subunit methyltransferase A [Candidatus Falkowbacteria bacterium]